MPDAANLNGIGIGADEEKPVVPDLQSKFFSSLQSFHIAGLTPGLGIRACENSFASAAFASSASLSPFMAAVPHRVVSFISVVGCGTGTSSGIRQNTRHVIESETSRHRLS